MFLGTVPSSSREAPPVAARADTIPVDPEGEGAARSEPRPSDPGRGPGRRTAAAGFAAAWLIYVAIFAGVFSLSGFPASIALRGAVANALPDGLLALVVIAAARRLPWPEGKRGRFALLHAALAAGLALLATAAKTALLWLDSAIVGRGEPFRLSPAVLAWQVFISLLVYGAVAGAAYAQANAVRVRMAAEAAGRAQTLQARAELAALRAQLNPHFLFNVLHSVLGLVRRDPPVAERALERLGDLLRYALHVHREGADWVLLRDEWEFAESYLDLERIRLGDRLKASLEAEPAALGRPVPSFSLQPLVENAVRHGIAPRAEGGCVRVSASMNGDTLRIEVGNTGSGAAPARPDGQSGFGLRVLRERLDALYGGRAVIDASPTPEGGFRVVLELPCAGAEEGDEA
jgi:hypothetical protein